MDPFTAVSTVDVEICGLKVHIWVGECHDSIDAYNNCLMGSKFNPTHTFN